MRKPKTHPYVVQPVFKALKVLEFVVENRREVSLSQVAAEVGLPKTTTFRYLRTLAATGFLSHDGVADLYGIGPRFRVLSQIDRNIDALRRLALPVMADLGRTFNETINLGVLSQGHVVYVEMIECSRSLRMQVRIGDRHPLHSTALGKAILAHLPADERMLFLSLPMDSMTGRTVTDSATLQHQLKLAAKRGYAVETGENEDGSMCIGAAILDETNYPIAALSLSAPESRMTPDVVSRATEQVTRAAATVSESLRRAAAEISKDRAVSRACLACESRGRVAHRAPPRIAPVTTETATLPSAAARASPGGMMLILTVAMFASSASMRVSDALLPQVAADFATTTGAASVIITAFAITYGLLQVVYGPVGDRVGKLRTIAAGALLAGLATTAASVAGSLEFLAWARLAAGATAAAIIPMSLAWIGDVVPYEHRQATLARALFASVSGSVLGQAAGGIIGDLIGWRAVFLILGAILLVAAAALFAALRLHPRAAALDRPQATHASLWQTMMRMASLLARPWVRVIVATVFCEGFVIVAAFAFVGADLHHRLGHSYAETGLGIAILGLGGLGYALAARRLVARLGEHGLARIGGLLVAGGLVGLVLAPDWRLAWPAIFVAGLGFYMLHNTLQTNATQMAPDARGSALGVFASCFFMGQAIGVAAIGAVVDRTGTPAVFLCAAAAIVGLSWWIAGRLRVHHGR